MKTVTILCHRCYNEQTHKIDVGGVETYAANLCDLFIQEGWAVTLLQLTSDNKTIFTKDILTVIGFKTPTDMKKAYDSIYADASDLTIFLLFEYGIWIHPDRTTIIVQHGIEFDGYTCTKSNRILARLQRLSLKIKHRTYLKEMHRKLLYANCVVCVDLNFINYVRAMLRFERFEDTLCYIPNFSDIVDHKKLIEKLQHNNDVVRIIVPRRFEYHRGIPLYAEVSEKLLLRYKNIEIAFIGEGYYEKFLHEKFDAIPQISIYKAGHEEILNEYYLADICVIPTLYSEGTSLSAIEAMCCCCSLVVSTVGGLGNLVIPGYNGIICEPTVDAFYNATCKLIDDDILRNRLMENAYNVAKESFSTVVWKERWLNILKGLHV